MYFKHLNATFGKLHQHSLTLHKGLNIIEAPNESGKSTFAAFLKDMLYGVPNERKSKENPVPERVRFVPWSGIAPEGSMDLAETVYGDITLSRTTKRATAPFGNLIATYSGSGETIEAITAENCGDSLLGISRSAFERSAFIHQSGLAIASDNDLEKRINALITSGEEDTSYSDADATLNKARNAHKHNATGAIPLLERELTELQNNRRELSDLLTEKQRQVQESERIAKREEEIRVLLQRHRDADQQEQYGRLQSLKADRDTAEAEYVKRQQAVSSLPSEENIAQAQAHLDALVSTMQEQNSAQAKVNAAKEQLDDFDHQTATQKVGFGRYYALLAPLTYIIIGAIWMIVRGFTFMHAMIPLGIALLLAVPVSYIIGKRTGQKERGKERGTLETAWQTAQNALDAQTSLCRTQEQTVLNLLRVRSIDEARAVIQDTTRQYEAMHTAQSAAKDAAMRYDVFFRQYGELSAPEEAAVRPSESAAALQAELDALTQKRIEWKQNIARAEGRSASIGDPADLDVKIEEKQEKLLRLQEEYDAISLAMEVLASANTQLQNRFSPVLGKRAAEIFFALTSGKYDRVLLDREMGAKASETDAPTAHDVNSLSQGAYDQLYFAVRLAICEMVLPEERNIPIVLDDALTNFDDERMKKALDLLLRESEKRQILLFTCQHREAEYLQSEPNVFVTTL